MVLGTATSGPWEGFGTAMMQGSCSPKKQLMKQGSTAWKPARRVKTGVRVCSIPKRSGPTKTLLLHTLTRCHRNHVVASLLVLHQGGDVLVGLAAVCTGRGTPGSLVSRGGIPGTPAEVSSPICVKFPGEPQHASAVYHVQEC